MSDVRSFLIGLGLERYAEVFERNEIELSDLEMLSDTDLQGLGIEALGPRRRLLGAIAARRSGVTVGADPLAAAGTFVAARAPSAAASGAADALSAGGTAFVPSTASSGSGSAAVKATGLSAGTKLGKYTVLKELGRGSMGVVFRAYDEVTELDVALKVIHPERLAAPGAVRQLALEVSKGLQVTHSNLLRIHGFEMGPPAHVVMELVDGETLTQRWVARRRQLGFDELRPILVSVLRGLGHLHHARLVHRDVKPDNVMISKDGQVKLTDFGVSASLGEQLSGAVGSAGTLRYMAPEALRGEICDARTDVYAVGLMAYQLLTGGFPYAENDVAAIRAWHLGGSRAVGSFAGADVIQRAWAARPEDRWESAEAMAEALERWEQGRARADAEAREKAEAAFSEDEGARFEAWRNAGASFADIAGDFTQAVDALEKARAMRPSDHETVVRLSDAYTSLERLEEASALLNEAITAHKGRRSKELATLQHRMARLAYAAGDSAAELEWLNAALDTDMQDGQVASELADVAMEAGNYDTALKALRAVTLMKNPGPMSQALAFLRQGQIAYIRGNPTEAIRLAHEALSADPHLSDAHAFLRELGTQPNDQAELRRPANVEVHTVASPEAAEAEAQVGAARQQQTERLEHQRSELTNEIIVQISRLADDYFGGSTKVPEVLRTALAAGSAQQAAQLLRQNASKRLTGLLTWNKEPHQRLLSALDEAEAPLAQLALVRPWMTDWGSDAHGVWAMASFNRVTLRFRYCSPGRFLMGSPAYEEGRWSNDVQHEVELTSGFWLAETPVTQSVWESVMGSNPSTFRGRNRPVENVSWDDVQGFLSRANGASPELSVRLPTEAEWEYACRAGTTGARYGQLDAVAWYSGNADSETHDVKQKAANGWGLYDMLGNVFEWCADWYGDDALGRVVDPTGPATGSYRVLRGGSYFEVAWNTRAAYRHALVPSARISDLGFRLARGQ
jgi:sulfatase modifying factor 1